MCFPTCMYFLTDSAAYRYRHKQISSRHNGMTLSFPLPLSYSPSLYLSFPPSTPALIFSTSIPIHPQSFPLSIPPPSNLISFPPPPSLFCAPPVDSAPVPSGYTVPSHRSLLQKGTVQQHTKQHSTHLLTHTCKYTTSLL